ncbi:MAG: acetyltransferase [Bacteroidetes bacterium]|nr:acetyltransferase [Bacteroidota bacterium]
MDSNKIIVIGAGLYSEEITDLIQTSFTGEIMAFIEGVNRENCGVNENGVPVIWIDEMNDLNLSHKCICAIGSPKRKNLIELVKLKGFGFTSLIHPSAQIFPSAFISMGSIIGAGTVISTKTKIGEHVIINRGCLIGHHVCIENYVTLSPGVNIAGKVTIKECAYIGMGAIILDGISIGANSVIGAGALVTKEVPDNVQVMGIPARITKIF